MATIKFDFFLLATGRLAVAAVSLIAVRAVTTILEPDQYGQLTLLLAVQTFCGLLLTNPVGQHINLHAHKWWYEGSLFGRLRRYWTVILIASTSGAVGAVFFTDIEGGQCIIFLTSAAMFLFVVFGTWNATLIPLLNMLGYRAYSVLFSLATALLSLFASIILVITWNKSELIWLLGQSIGLFCGALGARFFFSRNLQQKSKQSSLPLLTKETILIYCLPLALTNGFMWLHLSGYRFLIEYYWGLSQLGVFALGLILAGQIWTVVESLLMQFLYPLFFYRINQNDDNHTARHALSDLINISIPVYVLLAGLTISLAPYLIKLFVAPQFYEAVNFFTLGVFIEFFRVFSNAISNVVHVNRKAVLLILPYGIGAAVTACGICVAGMHDSVLYWAGFSIVLGGGIRLLIIIMATANQIKLHLDFGRCAASVLILAAMVVVSIYTPVTTELISIIAVILLTSAFTGIALLIIMRKSHAVQRMVSIQLRKGDKIQ